MNLRLAWKMLLGRCDWCKARIPKEDLKHCVRRGGGFSYYLRCAKCAGQKDNSDVYWFLDPETDYCSVYKDQIKVYSKATKHIFKRLGKVVQAYNIVAKHVGGESVSHPSLTIRIEQESRSPDVFHPCIYYHSGTNALDADLFVLDGSYSGLVETALVEYGKRAWNLLHLRKLLKIMVREYNDLARNLNVLEPSKATERVQIEKLLEETATRFGVEEDQMVDF
jgi:hypothetical protein